MIRFITYLNLVILIGSIVWLITESTQRYADESIILLLGIVSIYCLTNAAYGFSNPENGGLISLWWQHKRLRVLNDIAKISPTTSIEHQNIESENASIESDTQLNTKKPIDANKILPKGLWKTYIICLALSAIAILFVYLTRSEFFVTTLYFINLPVFVVFLVATLCVPVRAIQWMVKRKSIYGKSALYCFLLSALHIALTAGVVLMTPKPLYGLQEYEFRDSEGIARSYFKYKPFMASSNYVLDKELGLGVLFPGEYQGWRNEVQIPGEGFG